jgi:hypothetical protein
MGTKQQDFQITWTKASLVLNQGHKIKKSKAKTRYVHNVNAKGFYYKNMTRIEQDHDKDTYSKLTLNTLKVMWDSTSIYTHWDLAQGSFLKNFQPTCDPCSPMCDPYAPICGPCLFMWKLIVNYELIKNELEVNWNLITQVNWKWTRNELRDNYKWTKS